MGGAQYPRHNVRSKPGGLHGNSTWSEPNDAYRKPATAEHLTGLFVSARR
jgi:hypothetical protein